MLHGATAAIPDIYLDPRIPQDAYRPTFVRSLVITPIDVHVPVAAIGAYWRDKRGFTDREIAAIEHLADAVADALRRAGAG